jgi:hypothetical protein
MKNFLTFLTATAGLVLVGYGSMARGQQAGFSCLYDCSAPCGTYTCYQGNWTCTGGGSRNYLYCDNTLYGGCIAGGVTCESKNYMCVNRGYPLPGCGSGCCNILTVVTFCKC